MAAYGAWRVLSAAPEEVSLSAAVASLEQDELSGEGTEKAADNSDIEGTLSKDGVW